MICLEGTGALSHVSLRNKPEVYNEPCVFSAVSVKGEAGLARVLEGPLPTWKVFGPPGTGNGARGKTYGLPRFSEAVFTTRFFGGNCYRRSCFNPLCGHRRFGRQHRRAKASRVALGPMVG